MSKWKRGGYVHPCRRPEFRKAYTRFRKQWMIQNPVCAKCGRASGQMDMDHIRPLKSWGNVTLKELLDPGNVQTLCRPCHAEKTRLENVKFMPPRFCDCGMQYVDGAPICGVAACEENSGVDFSDE